MGVMEEMCNCTVVVKDMTQILTSNKDERNAVFGVLRNAYDGYLEKGFGTKKGKISLDSKFGLLIGITPIIDAYWSLLSQFGERFLKVRFRGREGDVLDKIFSEDMDDFAANRKRLQRMVNEYLESLTFNKKIELRFNDVRRFGYVQYLAPGDECVHRLLKDLGPEPLEDDFTFTYLVEKAARRSLPVKNFLMDAKIVVGLGNIYVNEALFRAGIHPLRSVSTLTSDEWRNLRNAVRHVLRAAVRAGGTTLQDEMYRGADGELGYFQMRLKVYQREGEKCAKCDTAIEKITMSGRSTFYCPFCQKYE